MDRTRSIIAVTAAVGVVGGVGTALGAHAGTHADADRHGTTAAADRAAGHRARPGADAPADAIVSSSARTSSARSAGSTQKSAGSTSAGSTGTTSGTSAGTTSGTSAATAAATTVPLWATTTALHDGTKVVPLKGITFVEHVQRAGDHWILQDVPEGSGPYTRIVRVDANGRIRQLALVPGGGSANAAGTKYVTRARDDAHYEVYDLTTGKGRLLPPPAHVDIVDGTALFAGDDIITGWGVTGTIYYRTDAAGGHARAVGLGPLSAQFSPGRKLYVGVGGRNAGCLLGGPATDAKPRWTQCPGGLATATPYSPDGTRIVTYASGEGGGGTTTAVVRDASTGRTVGSFALPKLTLDLAMTANDRVTVLSVSGPEGRQTTTVRSCSLTGACTVVGTGRGVGVLGSDQ